MKESLVNILLLNYNKEREVLKTDYNNSINFYNSLFNKNYYYFNINNTVKNLDEIINKLIIIK